MHVHAIDLSGVPIVTSAMRLYIVLVTLSLPALASTPLTLKLDIDGS